MLLGGVIALFFDGATAYTVNHLDTVPLVVNDLLHLGFLWMVDTFIFLSFLYVLVITDGFPKTTKKKLILYSPLLINLLILLLQRFSFGENGNILNAIREHRLVCL